ncbi:hypothetical protein [Nocardia sp. NPDC050435]|uniref:hypothetical protein n=1 Tax=Nocardia sp. NPDC050435 TaxID=3155040 RepID=UPI0033D2825A
MTGLLNHEQLAEALLAAFEDNAASHMPVSAPRVRSDGTTDEVMLEGLFSLDDIAELLLARLVAVALPAPGRSVSVEPGSTSWPLTEPAINVSARHEAGRISFDGSGDRLWLTQDSALALAARLITAAHTLNHPALANRSQR